MRDEMQAVLSSQVDENQLLKKSLTKLKKLDSFMKESQRIHPLAIGQLVSMEHHTPIRCKDMGKSTH